MTAAEPSDDTATGAAGTALITGASAGIGAGLAERFAQVGLQLALCARREPALPAGAVGITASVDVTDAAAVQAFVAEAADQLGPISLCVANAGILGPLGSLRDAAPQEIASTFRINVEGVAYTAAAYANHVRSRPGPGAFLAISSGAGRNPTAGWAAYAASKAAVDALCVSLAEEEFDAGLRVLSVAPGVVDTGMQAAIRATDPAGFPRHASFVQMKADGAFNSSRYVADYLLQVAFDSSSSPEVLLRVPAETAR